MRLNVRGLVRQVAVYGSGACAAASSSLLTLPILTRIFTPADYGVIETITTLVAVVGIIATLSLESAIQRSYFDYSGDDTHARSRVLGTGVVAMVGWSALLTAVLIALPESRSRGCSSAARTRPTCSRWPSSRSHWEWPSRSARRSSGCATGGALRHGRGLVQTGVTVGLVLLFVAVLDLDLEGLYLAGVVGVLPALALGVGGPGGVPACVRPGRAADHAPVRAAADPGRRMDVGDAVRGPLVVILHYEGTSELGLYALGVRSRTFSCSVWSRSGSLSRCSSSSCTARAPRRSAPSAGGC